MKYLHTLVALCAVVLFSACNEQEDFDRGMDFNYGNEIEAGFYTSQYDVNSKYEYALVVTENAKGEQTVYSYRVGKPNTSDSAVVRTTFVADSVAYDAETGILSAKASTSYYEEESSLYLCKLQNGGLVYELNYGDKKDKATLVKSNATPSVEGKWQAANADSSVVYDFFLSAANAEGAGAVVLSKNGGADEVGTYTTAHGTTTVTVGGVVYTLAFNGKFQLVATTDVEALVLDRVVSEPEPEQFLPIFGGVYTVNASIIDASGFLFGGPVPMDAVLYQSDKYAENFAIYPFISSDKPMYFTMDANGLLTVVNQGTGVESQYGEVFVSDILSAYGEANPQSYYDSKKAVFNFALAYHVPAGTFGFFYDTFQLTEEYTNKKEANFVKGQKTLRETLKLSENARLMK